jgi:nitrate reductase beta subunit
VERFVKSGREWSQLVHAYYTRPSGVANALEIALPLTPKSILFLRPAGSAGEPQARLHGTETEQLASKVNEQVIAQSLSWVVASPAHPNFTSMDFPPLDPLLAVCDGGSQMSEQLTNAPEPRRPRFLRDWD